MKEDKIVFQVNGKVCSETKMAPGSSSEQMKSAALADEAVQQAMKGKEPKKIIVVYDELVNVEI
jgi:leucyl-tRNA synthetase